MIPLNDTMLLRPRHDLPSAWTGLLPVAYWLTAAVRPGVIVELGSHHGASFLGFCEAVEHAGAGTLCHAVDTWMGDEHAGFYGEEVHARLSAIVRSEHGATASLLRATFDDARAHFAEGSVDVLHIDGLHTYDAVRHDFEHWLPTLSRSGVVLFHDTMVRERDFGVWKLWSEVSQRFPSFEFTHSHGLGVLAVGPQPPAAIAALCGLGEEGRVATRKLFEALGARIIDAAEAARRAERDAGAIASRDERITSLEACNTEFAAHVGSLEESVGVWHAEALAQRERASSAEADAARARDLLRAKSDEADGLARQLPELVATVDALRAEAAEASAAASVAEASAAASTAACAAAREAEAAALARCEALQHRLAVTEALNASLGAALQAERSMRAAMERRALDAEAGVRDLKSSMSWRVTAPLRLLGLRAKRPPANG